MEGIAKLVMSALVLLMSVDMCAQKINTKEFDKYIRKYDSLENILLLIRLIAHCPFGTQLQKESST